MSLDSAGNMPAQAARPLDLAPPASARAPARAEAEVVSDREHLPTKFVDSVRGLAATYVMLGHARFLLFIGASVAATVGVGRLTHYEVYALATTRYGVAAVMAFFLVSGYSIHYRQAFQLAKGELQEMNWRAYAFHRFRRLYPPLLAALVVTAICDSIGAHLYPALYNGTSPALDLGGNQSLTWQSLVSCLTFTQGFLAREFGTDVPLWSLAYEGFFYLVYPIVLAVNRRSGPTRSLFAFSVLGGGVALLLGLGLNVHALDLLALWPSWIFGMFIADARAGRVRVPDRLWNWFAGGSLVLLFGTAIVMLKYPQDTDVNFVFLLWILSFAGPLGWLCAAKHGPVTRARMARVCKPLLGLGAMSYSLYVAHFPVLALIAAWWLSQHAGLPTNPLLFAGGVVAALAVAYLVYLVAERPVTGTHRAEGRGVEKVIGTAAIPVVRPALAGVPAGMAPVHDARPYVPVGNTFIGTEDLTMREVRAQAEMWTSRRWQAISRFESARELGASEWGFVTRALGSPPERAWVVTMRVAGPGGDWSSGQQDTAVVALRQGLVTAIDPPGQ